MNKLHAALLALAVIAAPNLQAQFLQVETKAGVQDFAARTGTGGPARTWDAGDSQHSAYSVLSDLPDPQIAVGPADVFTVVSSSLSRYPNPNFPGATASTSPTFQVSIQVFLNPLLGSLCSPNPTLFSCVIINNTVRYDQMQGRFVLVTTVTDVPSKRSNFVLAVSNGSTIGSGFTGFSFYTIPLNVTAGSTTTISAGGSSYPFVSVPFCGVGSGPCTDYFPTSARLGLDNDNIILTAPVLDFSGETGTGGLLPTLGQNFGGPYAGTRVVTVPKMLVYNPHPISAVVGAQPGDGCIAHNACGAINLADNPTTGTLTGPAPQVFWEPDNLRGRALASFDSQLTHTAFTPVDYLAGAPITDWLTNQTSTATNQTLYLQPIRFVCPGASLTCPVELPVLGSTHSLTTFHSFSDPLPVGQSNSLFPVTDESHSPLFVGDSRPQQVIFREGLLYLARAVRGYDSGGNPLGTSMVSYDIFHPGDSAPWLNAGWVSSLSAPNSTALGFYAPMFDVPANVDSTGAGPFGSPVNVTPFLQNLFVGMTTGDGSTSGPLDTNHPSLWDFRPGDDAYDTEINYVDPVTGAYPYQFACAPASTCPLIPFGNRGSASTDPNDGSLWVFGEFAKIRQAVVPGPGVWGTALANYPLTFPATDPYGSGSTPFSDVPPGDAFFPLVQIAKNHGTVLPGQTTTAYGTCPAAPVVNPPVTSAPKVTCTYFKPAAFSTRSDLVRGIVLGQMDDAQVNNYLAATGGFWPSFIDTVYDPNFRYIEAAFRRGYIQACGGRIGQLNFCPDQPVTYGDAATAIIRAKLGNVFSLPPASDPLPYMQQLEQLQITAGTAKHYYSDKLTREEVAIYATRAFFL